MFTFTPPSIFVPPMLLPRLYRSLSTFSEELSPLNVSASLTEVVFMTSESNLDKKNSQEVDWFHIY